VFGFVLGFFFVFRFKKSSKNRYFQVKTGI